MTAMKHYPLILFVVFIFIAPIASANENEVNHTWIRLIRSLSNVAILITNNCFPGLYRYCKRRRAIASTINIGRRIDCRRSNHQRNSLEHWWRCVNCVLINCKINKIVVNSFVVIMFYRTSNQSTNTIGIDRSTIFSRSTGWQFVSIGRYGRFEKIAVYNTTIGGQCTMPFQRWNFVFGKKERHLVPHRSENRSSRESRWIWCW